MIDLLIVAVWVVGAAATFYVLEGDRVAMDARSPGSFFAAALWPLFWPFIVAMVLCLGVSTLMIVGCAWACETWFVCRTRKAAAVPKGQE